MYQIEGTYLVCGRKGCSLIIQIIIIINYYEILFCLGLGHEHFWTSGTDQAEEGSFFWLANGRPIGYTNWNAGEPNNFKYENGEEEHCLELWNRDGKGLKWNDSPCSFETFFVCEM